MGRTWLWFASLFAASAFLGCAPGDSLLDDAEASSDGASSDEDDLRSRDERANDFALRSLKREGDRDRAAAPAGGPGSGIRIGDLTVYVISTKSTDIVERAMAYDLEARGFAYMGPEDFRYAIDKPGYPYTLFTVKGLDAIPKAGTPLYEHEFVHMAAGATMKRLTGHAIAERMRPDGCGFTYRARFHEVCADWKHFVAPVYASQSKMRTLLDNLGTAPAYTRRDSFRGRVDVTGIDLVDAACLWDEQAMTILEARYDQVVGQPGAFVNLFPPQQSYGSCVETHMARARAELAPPSCIEIKTEGLNVRRGPGIDNASIGTLEEGDRVERLGEGLDPLGAKWLRIRPAPSFGLACSGADSSSTCWIHGDHVRACP